MAAPPLRVLISGAGIAGPTLAFFLSRAGVHVTIVERARELLPHGQNIDIDGSAIAAIKKMGLLAEIRRYHTTEQGAQFVTAKGTPFAKFPQNGKQLTPTSEFEILRGDLAKVLYDATVKLEHVTYLLGTTITAIASNDASTVSVRLSDKPDELHDYDVLIAADGQWSRIRKQTFPASSVKVVDKGLYTAYWTAPLTSRDNRWWNIFHAPGSRSISLRPDSHGTVRASFGFMPCTPAQKETWQAASRSDRATQEKVVEAQFADVEWESRRLLDGMSEAPDFYFQAVQQIRMSCWSEERVVCVGDAAYCPTPITGAGTTLAITGAYVLAGELSKLQPGEHPAKAFKAYEEALRPYVEKTQELPSAVPGVAHPEKWWGVWVLRAVVFVASRIVPWLPYSRADESVDSGFPLPRYEKLER